MVNFFLQEVLQIIYSILLYQSWWVNIDAITMYESVHWMPILVCIDNASLSYAIVSYLCHLECIATVHTHLIWMHGKIIFFRLFMYLFICLFIIDYFFFIYLSMYLFFF